MISMIIHLTRKQIDSSQRKVPLKLLTKNFLEAGWSGAGRQMDTKEVDWCARQRHRNSHQRVDGVTVERNHYQEYAAHAVDDWEK